MDFTGHFYGRDIGTSIATPFTRSPVCLFTPTQTPGRRCVISKPDYSIPWTDTSTMLLGLFGQRLDPSAGSLFHQNHRCSRGGACAISWMSSLETLQTSCSPRTVDQK